MGHSIIARSGYGAHARWPHPSKRFDVAAQVQSLPPNADASSVGIESLFDLVVVWREEEDKQKSKLGFAANAMVLFEVCPKFK